MKNGSIKKPLSAIILSLLVIFGFNGNSSFALTLSKDRERPRCEPPPPPPPPSCDDCWDNYNSCIAEIGETAGPQMDLCNSINNTPGPVYLGNGTSGELMQEICAELQEAIDEMEAACDAELAACLDHAPDQPC